VKGAVIERQHVLVHRINVAAAAFDQDVPDAYRMPLGTRIAPAPSLATWTVAKSPSLVEKEAGMNRRGATTYRTEEYESGGALYYPLIVKINRHHFRN
jgi:hypothetical protein